MFHCNDSREGAYGDALYRDSAAGLFLPFKFLESAGLIFAKFLFRTQPIYTTVQAPWFYTHALLLFFRSALRRLPSQLCLRRLWMVMRVRALFGEHLAAGYVECYFTYRPVGNLYLRYL